MNIKEKFKLWGYCVSRYEYQLGKLSKQSIDNIYNFIMCDDELNDVDELTGDFCSTYFELNDIELADCIKSDLVESD